MAQAQSRALCWPNFRCHVLASRTISVVGLRTHMSAQEICILAAFLAAGFVHGVAGFGAGIVAMSIIPAAFTMLDAVPIVAVLWLLVTVALLAGGLRKHLGTPELRATIPPLIGGAYAGVPLGLRLLSSVDQRVLRLALGVCMLVFVVERTLHDLGWLGRPAEPPPGDRGESCSDSERSEQLLTPLTPESGEAVPGSALLPAPRTEQPLATTPSRAFLAVLVGLGSGMLSGALNEGGPPVVIFLALQGWSKDSVKAGLQATVRMDTVHIAGTAPGVVIACPPPVDSPRVNSSPSPSPNPHPNPILTLS